MRPRSPIPSIVIALTVGTTGPSVTRAGLAVNQPTITYTVDYVYLWASTTDLLGAHLEGGKGTSVGSRGGLSVLLGRSHPEPLEFQFYSTNGVLPSHYSSAPNSSLDGLSILFGLPGKYLPTVKVARRRYQGTGVVEIGDVPFERDGVRLPPGSNFDIGVSTRTALFSWGDLRKRMDDNGRRSNRIHWSVGLADLHLLGVRQELDEAGDPRGPSRVDRELQGQGVVGQLDANLGGHSQPRYWFFDVENEWIVTSVATITQGGFRCGWALEKHGYRASLDIGLHGWRLTGLDERIATGQVAVAPSLAISVVHRWN